MILAKRFGLGRRALLRGSAAGAGAFAIPLPRLLGMLNGNGTAYADGAALPKRFGVWFFGNGVLPERWVPAKIGSGDAWQLSDQLAPLVNVKSHLSVVSGLANWQPEGVNTSSHHMGSISSLTGDTLTPDGGVAKAASIDHVIASAPDFQSAPFPSLELGLSQAWASFYPDELTQAISRSGPHASSYPEFNPRKIFTRLFGDASGPSGPQVTDVARMKAAVARRSALDLVTEDARQLRLRIGAEDRARLDAHLDGIRLLEKRIDLLASSTSLCPAASAASEYPDTTSGIDHKDIGGNQSQTGDAPSDFDDVMISLMALAFACDRTRVVSYLFACAGAQVVYKKDLGFTKTMHELCHDEGGDQPSVHKGVVYTMTRFARFLEKLKDTPDAAGTLLDSSCIYATSCVARGISHSTGNHPVLVAGKAGGALKGNVHYQFQNNESIARVLFTLANVMGVGVKSFGAEEIRVTDGVSGILG